MSDAQGNGRAPDQEDTAKNNDSKNDSPVRDKMQGSFNATARAYFAAGLNVIAVKCDGSKRPFGLWDAYKTRKTTIAEIDDWFGPYRCMGIVCGAVSGNLEVIDFDDASLFDPWCDRVRETAPLLLERLTIHKTPNGYHVIFRCRAVSGSVKLAMRAKTEPEFEKEPTLIETHGEGAQILVPGCAAACHDSKRLYQHHAGPEITSVATITPDERDVLMSLARTFDRSAKYCRAFVVPTDPVSSGTWELRPGDDFNERAAWGDVLPRWKPLYAKGVVTHWRRPGKSGRGPSATTGYCGDNFFVFSSNASPFEQDRTYSKFAVYTLLNHDGDFKAAAKELAEAGFGQKSEKSDETSGRDDSFGANSAYGAPPAPWPDPPSAAAFHGLAGELVRRIEPHSEADPAALLIQFLIAFGSIIGRTAYFTAEATRHYLNLFAVLVGATAKGRKGSSWSNIRLVTNLVDESWASNRVLTGLASGEGLIWSVRDPIFKREAIKKDGKVVDYLEVEYDPGVTDKRLLVLEQEFANVFKVAGREGNTLSPIIRLAWDGGTLQSMAKNSPAKATGAHISTIGHITDAELRRSINETEKANGFANRFIWVCVRRSKLLPEGGAFHETDIRDIVAALDKAITFAKSVGKMVRDDEARALWHEEYGRLSEGQFGMLGAILSRAEAQVMRIACIYALLDFSPTVQVIHLRAALAVWDYCERSARFIFGNTLGDAVADEVLNLLRRAPDGVPRDAIYNGLGRHRRKPEIERALAVLTAAKLARSEQRETGGRPSELWFSTGDTCAISAKSAISPSHEGDMAHKAHMAHPAPAQSESQNQADTLPVKPSGEEEFDL